MTDKKSIREGDLVTVSLNEYQIVSNTYQVLKKLEKQSILKHPLAPECLLLKDDSELNNAFPSMQNGVERCLFFAKKNKECLGYTMAADLDALCYYFVIKKDFSPKQRQELASMCGKIASVILGNNVTSAMMTIKQNKALLDEYNHALMNSIKKIMDDPLSLNTKGERYKIFNIAGFLLAHLSNS
jgi:hypothetical protein